MSRKYNFDYIIIGSGIAGSTVALKLAQAKKKVALIENHAFGGANLNSRDVPFLIASDFAHTFFKTYNFPELASQDLYFNLPSLPAREFKAIARLGRAAKQALEAAGVTLIKGSANFLDRHTIAIASQQLTAASFIIATGSKLNLTDIAGTELVRFLTPDSALKIHHLPEVVAVVGAGASGVEIAEHYAELGAKVILFEAKNRILPAEEPEVSKTLTDFMHENLDITILPNCRVVALEEDAYSKRVIFRCGNSEKAVRVSAIILATGTLPNLDLGLENAKVEYKTTGIPVNKLFQTSAKNIYAIGDCLGKASSTDRAHLEALSLANNLIYHTKTPTSYRGVVRIAKTFPEVAVIGKTENDLIRRRQKYKKAVISLSDITAGKINDFCPGFIKLLADSKNRLLGATIVAENAELLISELAVAYRHNLPLTPFASVPHNYNSENYLLKLALRELLNQKIK